MTGTIHYFFFYLEKGKVGGYWLPADDREREGKWYWKYEEDMPLADAYTKWAPGRPRDNTKVNCLYIGTQQKQYVWFDTPCTDMKYPLCIATVPETHIEL